MEVSNATATQSKSERSSATLASDFDSFLLLLTTQLQNQDPLEPMDAEKFTEQLVQFSGVEQAIETNAKLEDMVGLLQTSQTTAALQYLGSQVELTPDQIYLIEDGRATITYDLEETATSTNIKILDGNGELVRELNGTTASGRNQVEWDGLSEFGRQAKAGTYYVAVSAVDHQGQGIKAETPLTGTVDGVQSTSTGPLLMVDGNATPMTSIRSIFRPS